MRRGDLPAGQAGITFRWGRPGEGIEFKGGFGLSHIIAKHGVEVMEDVVETIARGKVVPRPRNRVNIVSGDTIVSLALSMERKRESWVLTGFQRGKSDLNFNLRELSGPIFFDGR